MFIELSKPSESEVMASNPECAIAPSGIALADAEGLGAHALSMRLRMKR